MPTFGYAETVTESQWSEAFLYAGASGVVASASAWKVTRQSGVRRVQIAAGVGFAAGIQEVRSSASVVDLPQPRGANGQPSTTLGQWFVTVASYERASGTVSFEAVPHITTSADIPTLAPATFPALQRDARLFQQPLAWSWVHPTDVAKFVDFDLRVLPNGRPAQLGSGIWRYARQGNTSDPASSGAALDSAYEGAPSTKNAAPGVYQIECDVVQSTDGGDATRDLILVVNGDTLKRSRRDINNQVTTTPIGETFVHPGGDLTWAVNFTTGGTNGRTYRAGTVATLTWLRTAN